MANEIKPSIKSVEGGSAITVLLTAIVAGVVILFGDRPEMEPENVKLIIEAGLAQAESVQDIAQVYSMAETPDDYMKVVELLAVVLPSTGFLSFFTKKRSDLKVEAMKNN